MLSRFRLRAGTTQELITIGLRDVGELTTSTFPDMPTVVGKKWTMTNAFFKMEGEPSQINIGLGRGSALDIFNNNIRSFGVVRW